MRPTVQEQNGLWSSEVPVSILAVCSTTLAPTTSYFKPRSHSHRCRLVDCQIVTHNTLEENEKLAITGTEPRHHEAGFGSIPSKCQLKSISHSPPNNVSSFIFLASDFQ